MGTNHLVWIYINMKYDIQHTKGELLHVPEKAGPDEWCTLLKNSVLKKVVIFNAALF